MEKSPRRAVEGDASEKGRVTRAALVGITGEVRLAVARGLVSGPPTADASRKSEKISFNTPGRILICLATASVAWPK